MRQRQFGKTDLRVSEMALGTWGLSGDGYGPVDPADAERTIARALDLGVTLFDTSDAYGAGAMEALLGKVLRGRPEALICTKGGIDRTTSPPTRKFDAAYIRGAVTRSLRRIGRDTIDFYLLHHPLQATIDIGDCFPVLFQLQREGKIRHFGVSISEVGAGRAAVGAGAEVLELPYNLFHSADLNRLSGDVMVGNAAVFARSPLAYGLLAGLWPKDKTFPEGDHRAHRWTAGEFEERLRNLDSFRFLVSGDVLSLRAAAIRFVLANGLVTSAVLGPRSVEQLEQIVREVGAGPLYLPDDALAALPRALAAVGVEV